MFNINNVATKTALRKRKLSLAEIHIFPRHHYFKWVRLHSQCSLYSLSVKVQKNLERKEIKHKI